LAEYLLEKWAWGFMSVQMMQSIISLAVADIEAAKEGKLDMGLLTKLSNLGTQGVHSQNCMRDLGKCIEKPPLEAALFRFDAPLRSQHSRLVIQTKEQTVLLPHVAFATMYHDHRHAFDNVFIGEGGVDEQERFWDAMSDHPAMEGHPMRLKPSWKRKTAPLQLHGDGTPVLGVGKSWTKMLDTYSFSGLLARGTTLDFTILIYCVFVHLLTKESMSFVWRVICWSLRALADGLWPIEDALGRRYADIAPGGVDHKRAGTDLAGGFCGVIWVVRGDLDYYGNTLNLSHHASSSPCSWCPANSVAGDPCCWTDFRFDECQWPDETFTNEDWFLYHDPRPHPLFDLPGLGIASVYPDWMHVKSMGTDGYTYASVLWLLVFMVLAGMPDAEERRLCCKQHTVVCISELAAAAPLVTLVVRWWLGIDMFVQRVQSNSSFLSCVRTCLRHSGGEHVESLVPHPAPLSRAQDPRQVPQHAHQYVLHPQQAEF
jgi:hypothetical protein